MVDRGPPCGEQLRWLTVGGTNGAEGEELPRYPHAYPAAKVFTRALVEDGVLQASFAANDVATVRRQLEVWALRSTPPDCEPAEPRIHLPFLRPPPCANLQVVAKTGGGGRVEWSPLSDSNRRPPLYKSGALAN